jgi:translation initiation factor 2 subunit 3
MAKKKKKKVDEELSADDLGIDKVPVKKSTKKKTAKKTSAKKTVAKKKKTTKKTTAKKSTVKKTTARKSTAKKSKKKPTKNAFVQSSCNVGLVGHVDHGKTTLTKSMTGVWTEKYADEINRGITIKLGYAEAAIVKCSSCNQYYTESMANQMRKSKKDPKGFCPDCGEKLEFVRRISYVDAPGHEILMATLLSGASLMDGALLLVAANEPVGMPQTKEHLAALSIAKIEKIIVLQNKVDAVGKERALEHYRELKKFLQKYPIAKDAPIIPISAIFNANIDIVINKIEEVIPSPELDEEADEFLFNIARSFDVNRPGKDIDDLQGGVIGGSILSGTVKIGDEVEVRPGIKNQDGKYHSVITTVQSIFEGNHSLDSARPGGLIALGTELDPSSTRTDQLIGNVVGTPGTLPDVKMVASIEAHLLEMVLGAEEEMIVSPLKLKEALMLVAGTTLTAGSITKIGKKNTITVALKRPICSPEGSIVAISRRIKNRYRLIGYGYLV